jgi:uncharacterized RDD family membrane protein YckC
MRWRDVKQGRVTKDIEKKDKKESLPYATIFERVKAFITDSFLLAMPIFYIVIYLVFDGLKGESGVEAHKAQSWLLILGMLGIVVTLFYSISGQTPGLKAYDLRVIDIKTKKKPSFILSFLRYLFFNFAFFSVIGLLVGLFRRDGRGIADLLSGTAIIKDS